MLLYDHDRTEQIVSRLRRAEQIFRVVTILSASILLGVCGLLVGVVAVGVNGVAIISGPMGMMVVGIIAGIILGTYMHMLISAVIEWMCQLLIAQGEMVAVGKSGKPAD